MEGVPNSPPILITDRIRRMREGSNFSLFVSSHVGGYPGQVQPGGYPSQVQPEGYPSGGVCQPGGTHLGYPPVRSGCWGTPARGVATWGIDQPGQDRRYPSQGAPTQVPPQ